MSDRIEAEILDALGEEVDAAIDTPLVVIEGTKGEPGADGITPTIGSNGNWFLGATDTGKPSRGANKTTVPTALKNPKALTIQIGGTTVTYDGSAAKTVTIADGTEVSY